MVDEKMAQLFMHEGKPEGFEFLHVRSLITIIVSKKKVLTGHIQACWALFKSLLKHANCDNVSISLKCC